MHKIIESIRIISTPLVISVLILLAGYFVLLFYLVNFIPFPIFVGAKRIYVYILAIGFLALLPVLAVSKYPLVIRFFLLIIAIVFGCLFSYIASHLQEEILASTILGHYHYYASVQGNIDVHVTYTTYKCDTRDLRCESIFKEESGIGGEKIDLIVDKANNELNVVCSGHLIFTDGEQPRMILGGLQYEGFLYTVTTTPVDVYAIYGSLHDQYTYSLYRCTTSFTNCQKLPFHYTDNGGEFIFDVNENTNELELHHWKSNTSDILIYSYGKEPKCYVKQCSIPGE